MATSLGTQATTAQAPVAILSLAARAMAERPQEARRIAAAVHLVLDGHVRPSLTGIPVWYVRSATAPRRWYLVERLAAAGGPRWRCTCPDQLHRGGACKHILAARLYRKLHPPDGGPPSPPPAAEGWDARVWLTPRGAAWAARGA